MRLFCIALFFSFLLGCTSLSQPALPPPPELASGWTDKPGWTAHKQMVAAAHPLAVQAGIEMLRRGGSAVDAAIATQIMLTLVEPQSSGIGGGAFMVVTQAQNIIVFDGRETAPAAATERLFEDKHHQPMSLYEGLIGGRSVGVPGVLRAMALAHERFGKLPWKALFEPAIHQAKKGFAIGPRLATLIARDRLMASQPVAAAYFYQPDGKPKTAGTMLYNLALADTLQKIADQGANAFYTGEIAKAIVNTVQSHPTNPGLLTMMDLAHYQAKVREAVCIDYRQRWHVCGPPASGAMTVGQMLGILAHFPLSKMLPVKNQQGRLEPSAEAVHVFSEAGRLAYADRAYYIGDIDFSPLPMADDGKSYALMDKTYLAQRAQLIGKKPMGIALPGNPLGSHKKVARQEIPYEQPSTSHVSIVDANDMSVSMTTSIEDMFGSRQMVKGFLLNNQLTDFSYAIKENKKNLAILGPMPNRIAGNKRPRSAMSPIVVFDNDTGKLHMVVGAPGGSAIINYVAKVLVGTLDWGLDMQQAINLPNMGSRNLGVSELEKGRVSDALVSALQARGHRVQLIDQTSGIHGIMRMHEEKTGQDYWLGGADPRREGVVMADE